MDANRETWLFAGLGRTGRLHRHSHIGMGGEVGSTPHIQKYPACEMKNASVDTAAAGAAIYSKLFLSVYDFYVLGFSNSFVWQCPSRLILAFYNEHISGKQLDVGVGTGYFLDKCQFPVPIPRLLWRT
jgi:hypothetical protein